MVRMNSPSLLRPAIRRSTHASNATSRRNAAKSVLPKGSRSLGASPSGSIGGRLRAERELLGMSLEEISRATRIPVLSLERLEADRFDDLPGEVFVRGFLRAYARTVGIEADEVLAHYTSARRVPYVAPVPVAPSAPGREGRRVGIAIAFVLLLVLCTMALSFVLKPRGRDLPAEISSSDVAAVQVRG
jgi:transcriptional regulator with XRE-family HTH domain